MTDPLFDEWRAYQKLLDNDYMGHAGFFQRLQELVRQTFTQPITILDLGCGDATPMLPLLQAVPVRHYTGIDITASALERAQRNLAQAGIPATTCEGDLLDLPASVSGPFDLIVASFSLHHLERASHKGKVLAACHRMLQPGGLLVVIDAFRETDESRDDYLERWLAFAREHYATLTRQERELLFGHVVACDYPDAVSTYQALGDRAGFDSMQVLASDLSGINHLLAFRSAA